MINFQLTYIIRGVERNSYVRAKDVNTAMQMVRDAYPEEIINGFVVGVGVPRPDYERPLPVTMITPTTHYEPNQDMPEAG